MDQKDEGGVGGGLTFCHMPKLRYSAIWVGAKRSRHVAVVRLLARSRIGFSRHGWRSLVKLYWLFHYS
jgi:hypothetical protein